MANDKSGKVPVHLWPPIATYMGSVSMHLGALKRGAYNWEVDQVSATQLTAAILRHALGYLSGLDTDPDDNLDNLGAILAGAAIILDARQKNRLIDDRHVDEDFADIVRLCEMQIRQLNDRYPPKADSK